MTGEAEAFPSFWWSWATEPELQQVQHLWFLINLTLYTVLCWPVFLVRRRLGPRMPRSAALLTILVLLSAAAVAVLKPHAAALAGDNYQFVLYLLFFLGGYLIGADHVRFLDWACLVASGLRGLAFRKQGRAARNRAAGGSRSGPGACSWRLALRGLNPTEPDCLFGN